MADGSLEGTTDVASPEGDAPERLNLEVDIQSTGACERHVRVVIPQADVERYLNNVFSEFEKEAQVPGFRPGKVPRRIIERKFRRDAASQVKSSLVVDALTQLAEEQKLAAIGEPDFDVDSIEVPFDGPMEFEFDIEVRPDFDLPDWKGLKITRPVREFTDADVDSQIDMIRAEVGSFEPKDAPAEPGDRLTVDVRVKHGDEVLCTRDQQVVVLKPELAFYDGTIEGFDEKLAGVTVGESRELPLTISDEADNRELQGQEVQVRLVVKKIEQLVRTDSEDELAVKVGLETGDELRKQIREQMERQLSYEQNSAARKQVLEQLTKSVDLALPPDLLRRQRDRELYRAILELQSAGFSEEMIRAREAFLRQNIDMTTADGLKQHFVLERIAEDEQIDATEQDLEMEVMMIAYQRRENPRKVRADIERNQQEDALRNQIVERKVLNRIIESASFDDQPYELPVRKTASLAFPAAGSPTYADAEEAASEEAASEEAASEDAASEDAASNE